MEDAVTTLAIFLFLIILLSVIMAVMLCSAEHENRHLRKENELFRHLWYEQDAMQNSCMNAYAEMFRRTGRNPKE